MPWLGDLCGMLVLTLDMEPVTVLVHIWAYTSFHLGLLAPIQLREWLKICSHQTVCVIEYTQFMKSKTFIVLLLFLFYLFISTEPGYYQDGDYGIRIEDVIQVVPLENGESVRGNFDGEGVLQFYDITMAPIQIKLMDQDLLTNEEITWLNTFHQRIREKTRSLLSDEVYQWLLRETEPIPLKDAFDLRCSMTCQ